jgi:hypothetical protein
MMGGMAIVSIQNLTALGKSKDDELGGVSGQAVLILSTIVLVMRTPLTSVGGLLFGQTRGRVLALLYDAPDEPSSFAKSPARSRQAWGLCSESLLYSPMSD